MTAKKGLRFHYALLVLAIGTIALVGAIGFARFGYSTVLPDMVADLRINNSQAGLLTTLALCGYLVAALAAALPASEPATLRRKRSTRPAVSTSFCLPVKNGWHCAQISTTMSPLLVERVSK